MATLLIGTQFEESGFGVNCQGFKILNKSFPLQTKVKSFEINGKEMEIIDTINEWYEEYRNHCGRNVFGQYPRQNPIVIAYKFKK